MNIRALTIGTPLTMPLQHERLAPLGEFARAVRDALEAEGLPVQTVRLATPSLSAVVATRQPAGADEAVALALELARELESTSAAAGFDYFALGPVRAVGAVSSAERQLASPLLQAVPQLVMATERGFFSAQVATRMGGIALEAVTAAARSVVNIAAMTDGGFGNLRFAVLANCPPHIPFFPAAYHEGTRPTLTIALEAADLAVQSFTGAGTIEAARAALVAAIQRESQRVEAAVRGVLGQGERGTRADGDELNWQGPRPSGGGAAPDFVGIDYSLAPFPEQSRSIAAAVEALGVDAFGAHGTLFAAAVITSAVASVRGPRTGFSGLMLPLLEDSRMAERAAEGLFSVDSLLMYSAVCGLGLDTVPLPGDVTVGEVAGILLDMAALAVRLDKPLTARLFPVPGKRAGDWTTFDFPYFANTRVLAVRGVACDRLLEEGGVVRL